MSGDALVSGIFIKNIITGSSADQCGLLKVGDRILGNLYWKFFFLARLNFAFSSPFFAMLHLRSISC